MNNTLLTKIELRKSAFQKRTDLQKSGMTEISSERIVGKILNSKEFILSKNVALYFPIKGEIDLTRLLNIKNKNFYFPRCINNELEFVAYTGKENLISGAYNITEPIGEAVNPEILDLIYIPALIANKKGYRLGYGKGYYDRFLSKNNIQAKKVIVVSGNFITDKFLEDKTDYKCDCILSEEGLIFA